MNNEKIKFRGKRLEGTGEGWVYGYLINSFEIRVYADEEDAEWRGDYEDFSVDPETVGQFIGKIKTGQEIYVNDLIQHGETVRIVSYRNGNTCLDRQNMKDSILLSYSENAKKLGNIFDNPELLTK